MKKRLVTSALPYVNNIPHLGNLIQVLSADVFSRFCRLKGYETLYVCGTDEYGTATETKALEEGVSPKELCDRFYAVHDEIYKWFNIQFDHFGRTSTEKQTQIVQHIFKKCDENGYISEQTIEQLYCESCQRFLADRYVRGTCPHCGYADARGDQCEHCGKLLDPTELKDPACGTCTATPHIRETRHLYINLPAIRPKLEAWMQEASVKGFWAYNAIQMTKSWIRDGLKERAITRDLKWGIPVPKEGFENKVFYVWFDAPIGYISITMNLTDEWENWWRKPDEVELFQFIGKDNIPFHTVIFPSSLLGTGETWTMLHHMSSTEYLNYEGGKFSKSKGVGVFGTDARDTGIPADVWRFYIFYNRPESSDYDFTWKDFQEKVNGELIGNLGNLINRTLTFVMRFFDGKVPEASGDKGFYETVDSYVQKISAHYDRAELRDAFRQVFALSDFGNKAFQSGEPWKTRKEDPEKAAVLLRDLVYLVRTLGVLIQPVMPEASSRIARLLNVKSLTWDDVNNDTGLDVIQQPDILFEKLEDELIETLKARYAGTQKERVMADSPERRFQEKIDLRVGEITAIERHPEADSLYIETLDIGGGQTRQIVSGLVPYYREDELLGKRIILAANLKPAKLRGVVSEGMLIAADCILADGKKDVEVLFVPDARPGTRIILENTDPAVYKETPVIKIDEFFSIPMSVQNNILNVGSTALTADGRSIQTSRIKEGQVG
ncbi:MAG: methionine--tRNA ligase [Spirochaetales bacterium]|nr:methionine--tRNA ligase [Spirochaetales bacterium]